MSTQARTQDLEPGSVVRVKYHTRRQTYDLEGVVTEDETDRPGVMVSFEDDPYAPVTTARVYASHADWLDAREACGHDAPLPGGYVRERVETVGATDRERPVA